MNEKEVKNLEHEALGAFRKSFEKRYEQWKSGSLLPIALQTMPKQVKRDDVLLNLVRLRCEREKNVGQET